MAVEKWGSCGLVGYSLRGFWRVYRSRAGTRGSCLPESSRIRGRQSWGKQGPAHVNKSQRGYMGSRDLRAVPTCGSNSHWRSNTHTHTGIGMASKATWWCLFAVGKCVCVCLFSSESWFRRWGRLIRLYSPYNPFATYLLAPGPVYPSPVSD